MQTPMEVRPETALDSWKEIAVFLRRGVRTVQRWEREEGLPVVRHKHLKRGSVRAYPGDLEKWQRQREQPGLSDVPQQHAAIEQLRSLMFEQRILVQELKRAHAESYAQWMLPSTKPSSSGQALALSLAVR